MTWCGTVVNSAAKRKQERLLWVNLFGYWEIGRCCGCIIGRWHTSMAGVSILSGSTDNALVSYVCMWCDKPTLISALAILQCRGQCNIGNAAIQRRNYSRLISRFMSWIITKPWMLGCEEELCLSLTHTHTRVLSRALRNFSPRRESTGAHTYGDENWCNLTSHFACYGSRCALLNLFVISQPMTVNIFLLPIVGGVAYAAMKPGQVCINVSSYVYPSHFFSWCATVVDNDL